MILKNLTRKFFCKKWKHPQEIIVYFKVLLMSLTKENAVRNEKVVLEGVCMHYTFKCAEPVFYRNNVDFHKMET